jgi:hypothetical protein
MGELDESRRALEELLRREPGNAEARHALRQLAPAPATKPAGGAPR